MIRARARAQRSGARYRNRLRYDALDPIQQSQRVLSPFEIKVPECRQG